MRKSRIFRRKTKLFVVSDPHNPTPIMTSKKASKSQPSDQPRIRRRQSLHLSRRLQTVSIYSNGRKWTQQLPKTFHLPFSTFPFSFLFFIINFNYYHFSVCSPRNRLHSLFIFLLSPISLLPFLFPEISEKFQCFSLCIDRPRSWSCF